MRKLSLTLFAVLGIVLFSCSPETIKNEIPDKDSDVQSAQDNAKMEVEFGSVGTLVDDASTDIDSTAKTNGIYFFLPSCASVVVDTAAKSMTVSFSDSAQTNNNCLCSNFDGKYRRGSFTVTWTGKYRDAGTVITTTLNDYYVNDEKLEGTRTVTNGGTNGSGNKYFSVQVSNGKITYTDGKTATWNSTRTREWVEGDSTFALGDDVYLITGSASGQNKNGLGYTLNIDQALKIALNCRWPKEGKISLTPDGKSARSIDYTADNGNCDSKAVVTILGFNFTITLP